MSRAAFTLLEVMISVMIISVVILALFEMRGNSTLMFMQIDKSSKVNQYLSFLVAQKDFGFEKKRTTMKNLAAEFDLDSDLRRKLTDTKVDLSYTELKNIDMSEYDEGADLIFEVGSTNIKVKDASASLLRIKLQ